MKKFHKQFRGTISTILLLILMTNGIFFNLYIQLFSQVSFYTNKDYLKYLSYNSEQSYFMNGWEIVFWIILTFFWLTPILSLIKNPDNQRLIKQTKFKLENISKHIIYTYIFLFFIRNFTHIFYFHEIIIWDRFFKVIMISNLLSMLSSCYLVLLVTDYQILSQSKIYKIIYKEEELFLEKKGSKVSTSKKFLAVIFLFSILPPLSLGIIACFNEVSFSIAKSGLRHPFYFLFILTIICSIFGTLVSIFFIFKSYSKPIYEVIKKMENLSKGDFTTKSIIYGNDEIASLKLQFNKTVEALKEREHMRDLFGRFLSQDIAKKLLEEGKISLGGDNIDAAVLFCDIRSFTSLSEKMTAQEVVEFLNYYFQFITEPIIKNNGVINKYIGDCVMVIFSPSFGVDDYSKKAINSALGMRQKLIEFNDKYPQYNTAFGIGIHTGTLVAGNIGTNTRTEYTIIGDTVNLAARVESETKNFNSDILISSDTLNDLSDQEKSLFKYQSVGKVQVKGREKSIELISILK